MNILTICLFFEAKNDRENKPSIIVDYFVRLNEYKQESENDELSKTAGELLENAGDPKFANSKVII